ncbi:MULTISPECIES: hydrogenase 4 subunit D [Atlantibacter]|uniref:hydrogenase 4 subunit D n=1 Tax=Atlantibacter TaxID=1903434 RepID=UPI0005C24789|nr:MULTISPECIES: hydrogenase 4 subunit D [Atlantibacter]KIU33992.1 hydrogenase 4 subunit D [Atlantibacter hermannii]MBW9432626.1 hydrogenase 4 subunit D [Atlantibacter hermannii]MDQ7883130.1 hydrogenase 4 subunit D [Atlantibacter hermannii]MDU1951393.1 hydrogenase 4 subunit D [Atlantibacter hermannii]MDU7389700.1 hydrogenase 4 subunit D [Atlantibacter hermannii]
METIALATLLIPFIGALLTACLPQRYAPWLCTGVALLATLGTVQLAWLFYLSGMEPTTLSLVQYGDVALFGFTLDRVSTLIVFAVVFLGFLVSLYSTGYLTKGNREHPHDGTNRYYALLLVFIGAMAGLVLSSTILGQLLFFEITGGCSWGLIGYYQSAKSQRSAMKALLITHVASIGLYLAAATLFLQTGTFALSALAELNGPSSLIVFGGILFAAWGKSAQLPLQAWLPDAMEAPTPVSAYLHAASMVKVGVYIFARAILSADQVPHIIGWIGMGMASLTIVYGFMMYLPQKDMKRLLAWSTITQLGWIFFALSMSVFGSKEAFNGGIAYIFNHAFAKSLFFLVAGALSYSCGTRMLPKLKGLMRNMPLLGVGFCVAALAIAGVPPFNGFFSKFPLFAAGFALSSDYWVMTPLMVLLLVESVASFAWLLYWFGRVVPGEPSEAVAQASPVPIAMRVVLIVLVAMSLCSSVIAVAWLG